MVAAYDRVKVSTRICSCRGIEVHREEDVLSVAVVCLSALTRRPAGTARTRTSCGERACMDTLCMSGTYYTLASRRRPCIASKDQIQSNTSKKEMKEGKEAASSNASRFAYPLLLAHGHWLNCIYMSATCTHVRRMRTYIQPLHLICTS